MIDRTRFVGFRKSIPFRVERAIHVRSPEEQPKIVCMQGAVYMPRKDCLHSIEGERIDCSKTVYLPPSSAMPDEQRNAIDRKFNSNSPLHVEIPSDLDEFNDPVLYLGHISPHFGHFLLESMSRMWAMSITEQRQILFTSKYSMNYLLKIPHVSTMLSLAGVNPENILIINNPTKFTQIEIPYPSICYSYEIYHTMPLPHQRIAMKCSPNNNLLFERPVYLSRSGEAISRRRIEGEAEVEAALARKGFNILSPEQLPLVEQINLFNNCPLIVGAWGSAMHLSLFETENRSRKRVTLMGSKVNGRFAMIDCILKDKHETYYISALSDQGIDPNMPVSMDQKVVLDGLKEIGVLN